MLQVLHAGNLLFSLWELAFVPPFLGVSIFVCIYIYTYHTNVYNRKQNTLSRLHRAIRRSWTSTPRCCTSSWTCCATCQAWRNMLRRDLGAPGNLPGPFMEFGIKGAMMGIYLAIYYPELTQVMTLASWGKWDSRPLERCTLFSDNPKLVDALILFFGTRMWFDTLLKCALRFYSNSSEHWLSIWNETQKWTDPPDSITCRASIDGSEHSETWANSWTTCDLHSVFFASLKFGIWTY